MKPILLVEDNPDDIELTRIAFEQARVANPLVVAMDGLEALEWAFGEGRYQGRDTAEQPVVIFLDLKLPKLGGLEVLQRLRADKRTHVVPIVILTTSTEEQDRLAAGVHHANSYVRKPVDFDTFVLASRQLGLYWTVLNEPFDGPSR